jgi:hypothetical protein
VADNVSFLIQRKGSKLLLPVKIHGKVPERKAASGCMAAKDAEAFLNGE